VQICIVIVLVLIPLIYTEALPTKQLLTFLVAPPPPPPPPPPPAAAPQVKRVAPEIVDNVLRTPTKIPEKIKKIVEDEAPVRAVTRQLLERNGYTVLEAPNGASALALVDGSSDLEWWELI